MFLGSPIKRIVDFRGTSFMFPYGNYQFLSGLAGSGMQIRNGNAVGGC